ncbi:MAG: CdaR family protein [Thermodesulfobacteriota bacterium]
MEKLVEKILKKTGDRYSANWGAKLLSLLLAVFLWYFVVGEDKVDMNILLPIEIVNLPRDLVISNQYKKELDVTVSGPRGIIQTVTRQNLSRKIDLSKAEPGTIVIRNTPESVSMPRGVQILRIQPTHLILTLDRLVKRNLEVVSRLRGEPAPGYEISAVELRPDHIDLTGPEALLGNLKELSTLPIDVQGLAESREEQIYLDLSPELMEMIGESVITAKVVITRKILSATLEDLAVTVENPDETLGYLLDPETIDVDIRYPVQERNGTPPRSSVRLSVNVQGLAVGRHILPVSVATDEGVSIKKIEPKEVQIDISRVIKPRAPIKVRRGGPARPSPAADTPPASAPEGPSVSPANTRGNP